MALMLAKTYAAFKAAGVDDEQAQAAAEELASFEGRFGSLEGGISESMRRLRRSMVKSIQSKPGFSVLKEE